MAKSMYDKIKKQNGERFAKTIRTYDSGIFDIENLDKIVRYAGKNSHELLPFLERLKPSVLKGEEETSLESPLPEDLFELLKKTDYEPILVTNQETQNSISHYFAPREELCTFKSNRFCDYHILHLVKKGADKLNREDFRGVESRDDEYGTSVISIQILKKGGFIKICNRYNHTVDNPDNTFDSNPDNIIKGLKRSLESFFNVEIRAHDEGLPTGYVLFQDQICAYHIERMNTYIGQDFYIKDGNFVEINKDYQMIVDNFMIDFKKNKIIPFYEEMSVGPFFTEGNIIPLIIKEVGCEKLSRKKNGDETLVFAGNRCILKSKEARLTFVDLKSVTEDYQGIFTYHDRIEEVRMENLEYLGPKTGEGSFFSCSNLHTLYFPNVKKVYPRSLAHLPSLKNIYMPKVERILDESMNYLGQVKDLDFKNLKFIGKFSLNANRHVKNLFFPALKEVGFSSISLNAWLEKVVAPNLSIVGERAFSCNPMLKDVITNKNAEKILPASRKNKRNKDCQHERE